MHLSHTRTQSFTRLVTLASLLPIAAIVHAQVADDGVWINAGIRAALGAGKNEYVLPAGTLRLATPIVLPWGTKSFTLRGSMTGRTKITTPTVALADIITIGNVTHLVGNGQFPREASAFVKPVKTGDNVITLLGTTPTRMPSLRAGSFCVLRDRSVVAHCLNGQQQPNHGELVRVVSVNAALGKVTIDGPAGREYTSGAQLTDVSDSACNNVGISDLSFDGTVTGGGGFSTGMISVGVADNVKLKNIDAKSFGTRVISTTWSRNVDMDDIDVADGANPSSPGNGYGITLSLSRFVRVHDSTAVRTRHAFVATNGSMDVTYERCTATEGGNFDTHGFDERRITYSYCGGDGGFAAGNGAWLGGGQDFVYDHCSTTNGALCIGPNVSGLKAKNCDLTNVIFDSRKSSPMGIPAMGSSDDITFSNCRLVGQRSAISGTNDLIVGNVNFDTCYIETDNEPLNFGALNSGSFRFRNCVVLTRTSYIAKVPVCAGTDLDLTFEGTKIYHAGGGILGINLSRNYSGNARFTNCTYETFRGTRATFLNNASTSSCLVTNCTAKVVTALNVASIPAGKNPSAVP